MKFAMGFIIGLGLGLAGAVRVASNGFPVDAFHRCVTSAVWQTFYMGDQEGEPVLGREEFAYIRGKCSERAGWPK